MKIFIKCVDNGDRQEIVTHNKFVVDHISKNLHLTYGALRCLYVAHLNDVNLPTNEYTEHLDIIDEFEETNKGLSLIFEAE